jgi:hypothetical protein
MHMIWLDVQFKNFHLILLTAQLVNLLPGIFSYITLEYAMTVLGAENDMILALIY